MCTYITNYRTIHVTNVLMRWRCFQPRCRWLIHWPWSRWKTTPIKCRLGTYDALLNGTLTNLNTVRGAYLWWTNHRWHHQSLPSRQQLCLFVTLGEEAESHKLYEIELKLDSKRNIYNHLPVLRKMAADRVLFCSLFTETRSSKKSREPWL